MGKVSGILIDRARDIDIEMITNITRIQELGQCSTPSPLPGAAGCQWLPGAAGPPPGGRRRVLDPKGDLLRGPPKFPATGSAQKTPKAMNTLWNG